MTKAKSAFLLAKVRQQKDLNYIILIKKKLLLVEMFNFVKMKSGNGIKRMIQARFSLKKITRTTLTYLVTPQTIHHHVMLLLNHPIPGDLKEIEFHQLI